MTASAWIPVLAGQVVDDYRVGSCLGGGEFGLVFEVTKLSTGARFAMKVLVPGSSAQAATEFDGESALLRKLSSCSGVINLVDSATAMIPVTVHGNVVDLPVHYFVMALASATLEDVILDPVKLAALPWSERLAHWRGAVKGVHQMHLKHVVHRDLKTSNCLLMLHKGETEVRVADLGRSRDLALPASIPPQLYVYGRGDARYAPPEHLWCQGGMTERDFRDADLYGLGSLFVELATGHPMTGLAIGSWVDARREGEQDLFAGNPRDLSMLRPKYRQAIELMAVGVPAAIRHDAIALIRQLCDPVPSERQPRRALGKRCVPDNGLLWLLRQADIMSTRLSVVRRQHRYRKNSTNSPNRSA